MTFLHNYFSMGGTITMDCHDYITVKPERRKEEHFAAEERGVLKLKSSFNAWVVKQVRERKWFLATCRGYTNLDRLFKASETVCTSTRWVSVFFSSKDSMAQ